MRKSAAPAAAPRVSMPYRLQDRAPAQLICLALVLALLALGLRILTIW